jgi:DNA-binding MarR family transcriptional regulator
MATPAEPWALPTVLLGATRAHLKQTHRLLAERGHPNTRPVHGFALQAIGPGSTTVEVAAALGVSKQAAGKTVQMLEDQGYVVRTTDPNDGRRKIIVPTERGHDFLQRSVEAFAQVRAAWADEIGSQRLAQLEHDLDVLCDDQNLRLDTAGWVGATADPGLGPA